MTAFSARASAALAPLFAVLLACGSDAGGTPATSAAGAAPERGGAPRTLMLATTDVALVTTGPVEDGVAITGVLRPYQSASVRARLEGDIDAVYVREGETVRSGQVLAHFEAVEQVSGQASARAERVAAEGELSTAQWNLDQTRELHRAGAVAERDLRTAEQTVTTARARLAAARAREQTSSMTVRDTRVLAPISAIVERRLVEPGERVSRGAELFTLVRNEILELTAAVPERRASAIAPGQPVRFEAAGRRFSGRVARISPTIDPATRSITVYVQVPNPAGALRGGTFATGVVVSRTIDSAMLVPLPAVRQTAGREQFVYRIAGNEVEQVSVTTGLLNEAAGVAQITSGLAIGDRVIVGNVGTVGRGMRVQVIGGDAPDTAAAR